MLDVWLLLLRLRDLSGGSVVRFIDVRISC